MPLCFPDLVSFVGGEFFFGIPNLSSDDQTSTSLEATVGTPSPQAGFVVESIEGEIASGTANSSSPIAVSLNNTFQVMESGMVNQTKGIRVHATDENLVYILVSIKYHSNSGSLINYGLYLVHPNTQFPGGEGYVYYAVTAQRTANTMNQNSHILLIGNHNNTFISVNPTQTVHFSVEDAQNDSALEIEPYTTHNITLHSLQTVLLSSVFNLTGTKIISNMPLTVISGHQCEQIPGLNCAPKYIQLLPTFNWGQQFLLAPFGDYKLVTSEDSTTVSYRCGSGIGELAVATAGNSVDFPFSPTSYCYLNATSPIFVVQMAASMVEDGDFIGLAIVAPTTGYTKKASFISPSDFPNSFIAVTVLANHFTASQIQLDGIPLDCTWNAIRDPLNVDVGHGCTYSVSAGPHVVSHAGEAGVLSVLAYGRNTAPDIAYAYLANYNLGTYICT